MELRDYFSYFVKWFWLVILFAIVGSAAGYVFSTFQVPVYQAKTQVLVMRSAQDKSSDLSYLNEQQLTQTYVQILKTSPVLNSTAARTGYAIPAANVSVSQVPNTQILTIVVEDTDPVEVADFANNMVAVLIEQNDILQTGRYAATEATLQSQITQIESQINLLQQDIDNASTANVQEQIQHIDAQIEPLVAEKVALQQQIAELPAYVVENKKLIAEKQARLDEIEPLLTTYQEIRTNLQVLGQPIDSATNADSVLTQMRRTMELYQQIYLNLLNNLEAVRLAKLQNSPTVAQIEPAVQPLKPIRPNVLNNILLSGVLGILLAAGIAFLVEYLDDTVKGIAEIEEGAGAHVIGFVALLDDKEVSNQVYVQKHPRSSVSEAFRSVRTNLDYAQVSRNIKTILVTSSSPNEGKSTISTNLAAILSQGDKKVILLDADMRKPSLHKFFGLTNRVGLTNIFRNQISIASAERKIDSMFDFTVITSGNLPPNPSELLASSRMDDILEDLKKQADYIIIDSPPTIITDSQILAAKVDAVILVAIPSQTKVADIIGAAEQIKKVNGNLIGFIFNKVTKKNARYSYKGYHYYPYYYSDKSYYLRQDGETTPANTESVKLTKE